MSQRRNLPHAVNGSSRNSSVSGRQSRTSVSRDSNESTLSERPTSAVPSSLPYMKNDVEKEHEKEEPIDNEDVDVQLVKLQREKQRLKKQVELRRIQSDVTFLYSFIDRSIKNVSLVNNTNIQSSTTSVSIERDNDEHLNT